MKIIRALALLTLIFTLSPPICHAQKDTVVSVAFMTRDKNLWPDYRANRNSLDRLANFLKHNPDSRVYLNVTCASHSTASENLATARERLTAVRAQMAQRFSLEKFLQTSKISTIPVAGRTDIAVIVVKMQHPETTTAAVQTPTKTKDTVAKSEVAVVVAKAAEPEPKHEKVVIAAAVIMPAQTTEKAQPADTVAITAKISESANPTETVALVNENEPIEFTADEITTLINQADNFVLAPEFDIPIAPAPHELPQPETKPNTYTRNRDLLPPVKYLNTVPTKKSRRGGK